MPATLSEIRAAIAVTLRTVTGLHGYAHAPDDIVTPCAFPIPVGIEYETMGRGFDRHTFDLVVLAASSNDAAGQQALDAFIGAGTRSIRNAIWADPTLGAVVQNCVVNRMRDYGFDAPTDGQRFYRAILEITVLTTGV